jgi:hypothetical protein
MRADDREDPMGRLIVAIKELPCCGQEGFDGLKEFAMGHLPSEMAPQHLYWVRGAGCKSVSRARPGARLLRAPRLRSRHPDRVVALSQATKIAPVGCLSTSACNSSAISRRRLWGLIKTTVSPVC